jgi:hypothetical protein
VTHYYASSTAPSQLGAINATRFASYEEAEAEALKMSVDRREVQTITIYRQEVVAVARIVVRQSREVLPVAPGEGDLC